MRKPTEEGGGSPEGKGTEVWGFQGTQELLTALGLLQGESKTLELHGHLERLALSLRHLPDQEQTVFKHQGEV